MSYHNVKLVSKYKTTVYKRWVWRGVEGDGGGSTLDFPFLPWLTLFLGLLLEIVISRGI